MIKLVLLLTLFK